MINSIILKIKRKETPFYAKLNDILKKIRKISFPCIKFIHLPLYYIYKRVVHTWSTFVAAIWITPIFKARCEGGKRLKIYHGMPWIYDEQLKIRLGDDVTIVGACGFSSGHAGSDTPTIIIGDRSTIGYASSFSISSQLIIGSGVMIGSNCNFFDNDGHPLSASKRRRHQSVSSSDIKPITIEDNVWIGMNCTILKGVTIGENSIVSAGSVVIGNIPPNKIYMGIPARAIGFVPE